MKKRRPENPRWRALNVMRKRINVSTRLEVEYLGQGRERLTCRKCGWSIEQNCGGMSDKVIAGHAASNYAFIERLVKYRGHANGIWGICDGCTEAARDERYPQYKNTPRYL